ncbi:MAG: hypothetical protein ACJAY2_002637 [Pseudomonadales bacterium]|jgi:hypothetical protein
MLCVKSLVLLVELIDCNKTVIAPCIGVYQGLPLSSGGSRVVDDGYCAVLIYAMGNTISLGVKTNEHEFPKQFDWLFCDARGREPHRCNG